VPVPEGIFFVSRRSWAIYAAQTRLTGALKLRFTSTSRSDGVLTSAGFISFAPLTVLVSTRRVTHQAACSYPPKSLEFSPTTPLNMGSDFKFKLSIFDIFSMTGAGF
jgi:hypothetical protein